MSWEETDTVLAALFGGGIDDAIEKKQPNIEQSTVVEVIELTNDQTDEVFIEKEHVDLTDEHKQEEAESSTVHKVNLRVEDEPIRHVETTDDSTLVSELPVDINTEDSTIQVHDDSVPTISNFIGDTTSEHSTDIPKPITLTAEQLARIEENRQKALRRKEELASKENATEITPEISQPVNSIAVEYVYDEGAYEDALKSEWPFPCTVPSESTPCRHCRRVGALDAQLRKSFFVPVCVSCRMSEPLSEDYGTVPRSAATSAEWCLPADLLGLMPSITRPNPQNSNWQPMRLFLRRHLMVGVIQRFKTLEAWRAEKQTRSEKKFERDAEKLADSFTLQKQDMWNEIRSTEPSKKPTSIIGTSQRTHNGEVFGREVVDDDRVNALLGRSLSNKKRSNASSSKVSAQVRKRRAILDVVSCIRGDK